MKQDVALYGRVWLVNYLNSKKISNYYSVCTSQQLADEAVQRIVAETRCSVDEVIVEQRSSI